jgi:phosphatidylserine/phosphatidylglycerophosphate/cardiolipin synthase-like enzyme
MFAPTVNNKILVNQDYAKILLPLIRESKQTIHVLMFDWKWYKNDFSCDVSLINQALIQASRRGVKVKIITNSNDIKEHFLPAGIEVKPYKVHGVFHAKLFILDSSRAIIGSHNMTQGAMSRNYEVSFLCDEIVPCIGFDSLFKSLWQS